MTAYDIISKPVVTEASMAATADRKYTFVVDKRASKVEIANAVEKIFDVKVDKVTTINDRRQGKADGYGSSRQARRLEEGVCQLTADSKTIELFEGMV